MITAETHNWYLPASGCWILNCKWDSCHSPKGLGGVMENEVEWIKEPEEGGRKFDILTFENHRAATFLSLIIYDCFPICAQD